MQHHCQSYSVIAATRLAGQLCPIMFAYICYSCPVRLVVITVLVGLLASERAPGLRTFSVECSQTFHALGEQHQAEAGGAALKYARQQCTHLLALSTQDDAVFAPSFAACMHRWVAVHCGHCQVRFIMHTLPVSGLLRDRPTHLPVLSVTNYFHQKLAGPMWQCLRNAPP